MTTKGKTVLANSVGLVLLADFKDCNPQGDPDRENACRTDVETGHGLWTASGIKRKIRDVLQILGHDLYVSRGACYETVNEALAKVEGLDTLFADDSKIKKNPQQRRDEAQKFYDLICQKYIDPRFFGQLVTALPISPRGPVQVSMARSIDVVQPTRASITRQAVATEDEAKNRKDNRTMGSLWFLPYGLYRAHIFIGPNDARKTGFTEEDYELLIQAIVSMFDNDRSSTRTGACVRGLYEFRQKEHKGTGLRVGIDERLLEGILVRRVNRTADAPPPRLFSDYEVGVPREYHSSQDFSFREIIKPVPAMNVEWSSDHSAAPATRGAAIGTAE